VLSIEGGERKRGVSRKDAETRRERDRGGKRNAGTLTDSLNTQHLTLNTSLPFLCVLCVLRELRVGISPIGISPNSLNGGETAGEYFFFRSDAINRSQTVGGTVEVNQGAGALGVNRQARFDVFWFIVGADD
jgi:hypothetical protein